MLHIEGIHISTRGVNHFSAISKPADRFLLSTTVRKGSIVTKNRETWNLWHRKTLKRVTNRHL